MEVIEAEEVVGEVVGAIGESLGGFAPSTEVYEYVQ